jgi:N6-adenosine-specific RNA methylase IME4
MLGCYVDSDNGRGFVTAIDSEKYTLHNGMEIPVSDAPITLWTPPNHFDLNRYLDLLGADPLTRISTIFETWNHAPNLADLPKPTHTEKYGNWAIGAVFKDSKLIQLQITNEHGSWAKNIKAIAATKKDCFSLARSSIDYAEAVLCHLPDPNQFDIKPDLSWESSQDSESITLEHIPYDQLDRTAGTQQRQSLNPQQLEEYESRYKQGEEAPPAEVYRDPETGKLILKHGFHRDIAKQRALGAVRKAIEINDMLPTYGDLDATVKAGFEKELYDLDLLDTTPDRLRELEEWLSKGLYCQIKLASESDAVWDSCSDNADNGATRSRADLYRAVDTALRHPKAKGMNDSEIARHVKTTTKTIRKRRGQLEAAGAIAPLEKIAVKRGDKTYTMNIKGMKRPDAGRKGHGYTFPDTQALYAPYGEFKRNWDAIKKFVFEWPEGICHFKDLNEAHDKFAKVTDGLTKLVDRPQPETPETEPEELPTFAIGDYVRGFDYTDGRRELRGYVAAPGDKVITLDTGKRIFANSALLTTPRYAKEDDRGQQKEAIAQTIEDAPPEFKSNNYSLVVIDPPWEYNLRESDQSHRGRTPYPAMDDHAIVNLPISNITAADSYCLLWATANHLPLAFKCLEAWGFEHKAVYTWVKTTISGDGVKFGLGHYGRNCAEFFLVGIKGNPGSFSLLGLTDVPTVIHEAPTEHSVKPEKFYRLAHRLSNALGGETIELFARSDQPGWDLWGAEAPTKIQSQEVT